MANTITAETAVALITVDVDDRSAIVTRKRDGETVDAFVAFGNEIDPDDGALFAESEWQALELALGHELSTQGVTLPDVPPDYNPNCHMGIREVRS